MLVPLQALIADCRLHETNSAVRPLHQGEGLVLWRVESREALSSEAFPTLPGAPLPEFACYYCIMADPGDELAVVRRR